MRIKGNDYYRLLGLALNFAVELLMVVRWFSTMCALNDELGHKGGFDKFIWEKETKEGTLMLFSCVLSFISHSKFTTWVFPA